MNISLRLPDELHGRLKLAARDSRRSLNAEMVFRLERSFGSFPAALTERDVVTQSAPELERRVPGGVSRGPRKVLCEHRIPAGQFCKRCD